MANPSRMKRDIDKAKRDRADEKRERRQRHADADAGAAVAPGRYFAQLVKIAGETVTPLGTAQSFEVKPLPR